MHTNLIGAHNVKRYINSNPSITYLSRSTQPYRNRSLGADHVIHF